MKNPPVFSDEIKNRVKALNAKLSDKRPVPTGVPPIAQKYLQIVLVNPPGSARKGDEVDIEARVSARGRLLERTDVTFTVAPVAGGAPLQKETVTSDLRGLATTSMRFDAEGVFALTAKVEIGGVSAEARAKVRVAP